MEVHEPASNVGASQGAGSVTSALFHLSHRAVSRLVYRPPSGKRVGVTAVGVRISPALPWNVPHRLCELALKASAGESLGGRHLCVLPSQVMECPANGGNRVASALAV